MRCCADRPKTSKRPGWRLFYFDFVQHHVFLDLLAAHPDVHVEKLAFAGDVATNFSEVARSQVYQATSVRDDLPTQYAVDTTFLARAPELLVVSTHGAGYDTVDVAACTAAGVLLVNQSGGNAEGVAEHAVAMMLSVLKRIPDGDARTRGWHRLRIAAQQPFGRCDHENRPFSTRTMPMKTLSSRGRNRLKARVAAAVVLHSSRRWQAPRWYWPWHRASKPSPRSLLPIMSSPLVRLTSSPCSTPKISRLPRARVSIR
jgi:lactate dehydrogenase-like 2-hydroxyacid dehydrogenase